MADRLCPRCGKPLQAGAPGDGYCAGHPRQAQRLGQQPVVLVGVLAITAALWTVTHFLTRVYVARQTQLARQWYARGESDLQAARLDTAITEFRTALVYSRDNFVYRLRLAQALIGDHQLPQAEAYLRALWEEEPGNGTVNLELARLGSVRGDFKSAVRYYHGAIYGFWSQDPAQQRRQVQLELVQILLQHKALQQAESELIALAADLPRDPAALVRVAKLFQAAGGQERALLEYRQALALEPRDPAALAGAGDATFRLQRYREARGYLRRAVAADPQDSTSAELLQTAELVLQLDPFERGLSFDDRARRVARNLEQAQSRLEACAGKHNVALNATPPQTSLQSDYAQLLDLKRRFSSGQMRRDPELADTAMDLVFRAERDAAAQCGAAAGPDYALLLIGRQREGVGQ